MRSGMRWTVGIFVSLLLLVVVVVVVFFVITYFAPNETSVPVAVRHNSNQGLTLNFGYLDAYLHKFLDSAEKHFMIGLPVRYYVFTDLPEKVPQIQLGPQRKLKVIRVSRYSRWQDISMMRMETISQSIGSDIRYHSNYVFCFDVDQEFKGRFGSEALGDSVALLHAHYYKLPKERFTYDKNPKSKAYMETGDFYYHAAIFGGLWQNVKNLTDSCYLSIMEDKKAGVEALWHDESHLNKYFWLNKPSRLLSPEYCWDQSIGDNTDISVTRLIWAPKNYQGLRVNVAS
ncbi:N-acetyllactosaminide alpha-1,3-galactosyltransferase-like isoform X2 [Nelusetta ayraudi]|uniref:N-acetyllactosaminide alpha-1,3-galactosyltransferase-like isoform X2 n=1 Tax=Nelusetta ayraudi TaxID=303726 RepID=UPI003F6EBABE